MLVHDLLDHEGRIFAFEIGNTWTSRDGVARIVAAIPGVRMIREPKFLSWLSDDDVFCEFELEGVQFEAWEPFGDKSPYSIGPEPPRWVPQIERVRDAFLSG